ncbi:OmpA family protein [Kangiella sp. M94]
MKFSNISRLLSLFVLTAAASQVATAEDSDWKHTDRKDSGWYIGGNIGQSYADIDKAKITSSLLSSGFTTTAFDADERDTGYKLFGGYQFNSFLAVEFGKFDLGGYDFIATTQPAGTLSGAIEIEGYNLDLVGTIPFTERFSVFGRVGAQYAEAEDQFRGTGLVNVLNPNPEESDTNYKVGLGLQYAMTRSLDMRFEVERYRIDDAVGNTGDIDMLSLGLVYRFGQTAAPAKIVKAPPTPVAEPILVLVPATEQYCSILDIQFDINQDSIELDDQEKLSVVGTFMNKYPDTTAVIEGHTDSVGSEAKNLELSQQRAQHVVNYLVTEHNIERARLKAIGKGATRPLASNSTDAGKRLNRRIHAIIACAQDIKGLEPAGDRMTMALQMEFDTNQANVKPQYHDELEKVAQFMRHHPDVKATVEGHASNRQSTTATQSMQLSSQRARNVVNYLVTNFGIESSRFTSEGFGETRRVAYNTTIEGQQENQRVNILFTYE